MPIVVNTEDFKNIKTYEELIRAASKVRSVVSAFCSNAFSDKHRKFASCEACPFYSKRYDDCLSGFISQCLAEEIEQEE